MKRVFYCLAVVLVQTPAVQAQDIEAKLSGGTAAQGFTIEDNANNALFTVRGDGNAGIGTSNPAFKLSLDSDGGILAKGTMSTGATLPSTSFPVMIWYPRKAAFRAGEADQGSWNDANVGQYSFASGFGTVASNTSTSALGRLCSATGQYSTSMGLSSQASGIASIAVGNTVVASGDYSTAFGNGSYAGGACSIAMGLNTNASGDFSTAIGSKVSTNGKSGVMYLGDQSSTSMRKAYADNHFYAVFDHGFSLFTDASAGNTYCVYLLNHSTSWLSCSDSTKKTNYRQADGEAVLDRFSRLRLGSWNFVDHDPVRERHYGPMAQEWFSAFGRDGLGVIGNDTSLASADVDGIAYIAIQALERRTEELRKTTQELASSAHEVAALRNEVADLKTRLGEIERYAARISPTQPVRHADSGMQLP